MRADSGSSSAVSSAGDPSVAGLAEVSATSPFVGAVVDSLRPYFDPSNLHRRQGRSQVRRYPSDHTGFDIT
jgi:predicted RNA-binding protein with PUA-like domain